MRTIARHEIDVRNAEESLEIMAPRVQKLPGQIVSSPLGLGLALRRSLDEFGNRCASDERAAWSDTWYALVRAMQAGAGLFQAASAPDGEEVEFRFGEDLIKRPATGPTQDSHPVNWLTALWLAVICRERSRIDLLANVPIDVLRASGGPYDEFFYSWVHALQVFWRREDNMVEALLEAMRGTDPGELETFDADSVLQLYYPPMELLYRLTQREDDKFNDALVNALELHKRYWTAKPERAQLPNGFVALGPLAIACMAKDAGVTIDVESDYLPFHLLEGTRVGEMTT